MSRTQMVRAAEGVGRQVVSPGRAARRLRRALILKRSIRQHIAGGRFLRRWRSLCSLGARGRVEGRPDSTGRGGMQRARLLYEPSDGPI